PTLSLVPPTYAVAPPPLTPSPPPSLHDALPIWVGTAVAVLLTRAGHQVAAVSGRGATTERAARWLPGVPVLPLGETAALGDLVLLGVPDDVLGPVVAELAKAGTIHAGCWVTHLSGATGLGVLLPLRELGGRRLAAHPLQ